MWDCGGSGGQVEACIEGICDSETIGSPPPPPPPTPPNTPEATPITPEATPITPVATPITPVATPITPEATPITPEATPITPVATPTPTPTPCSVTALGALSGTVTKSGSWSATCNSVHRPGKYARFYSFSVSASSAVTIDLTSSLDTYLYLLNGSGTSGSVVEKDDDDGVGFNSRITRTLPAGTYTVEATTYSNGKTGSFTLKIKGPAVVTPTPTSTPTPTPTPVFNVSAINLNPRLQVMAYRSLISVTGRVTIGSQTSKDYEFRLAVPALSGFQVNTTECDWGAIPFAPRDLIKVAHTKWIKLNQALEMVRCWLGIDSSIGIEARLASQTGVTEVGSFAVQQARHRADHSVQYTIESPLLPTKPSTISSTFIPNSKLSDSFEEVTEKAAAQWEDAVDGLTIATGTVGQPDVTIKGYWNSGVIEDKCLGSIACVVYTLANYPHLGEQTMWIEYPPQFLGHPANQHWTDDIDVFQAHQNKYEYLPLVLVHEFGHTIGLGHPSVASIMASSVLVKLNDYDKKAIQAIYGRHKSH